MYTHHEEKVYKTSTNSFKDLKNFISKHAFENPFVVDKKSVKKLESNGFTLLLDSKNSLH